MARAQVRAISFSAVYISRVHTWCAFAAFLTALSLGILLHYKKIVKNGVAGYPEEWWPSVSATIGDWYPERNIFQILIALTSGPRFALVICWYLVTKTPVSKLPEWVFITGLLRTISCGGWVYITSSDDGNVHDFLMISYIVMNIPWMVGSILCSTNHVAKRRRKFVALSFFGALPPMIYLYIRHKVKRIPGAYTHYSFFEWFLIFADIYFDSLTIKDFEKLQIVISEPTLNENLSIVSKSEREAAKISPTDSNDGSSTEFNIHSVSERTAKKSATSIDRFGFNLSHPFVSFISDSYLSYVWWSVMTSLVPSIFYFSVWELAIAGSEVAVLTLLSPYLLSIRFLRDVLRSHQGRTTLYVLSLVGLVAFYSKEPMTRLLMVSFANIIATMNQGIEWIEGDSFQKGIVLGIGLMTASVSKLMNHSNNPIWPIVNAASGGHNKIGLLLAILAVIQKSNRSSGAFGLKEMSVNSNNVSRSSIWTSAASLGALLYAFHAHLGDTGTLIAWSWTGYPIKGPIAGVHNPLVILAMTAGFLLSSFTPVLTLVTSPTNIAFGATSLYAMYTYRDWPGFFGGLGYTLFLCSIAPAVLANAASSSGTSGSRMGKVLGSAWLVYVLLLFADVWTVAYAFVPGGVYLRERTDLVLLTEFICIVLGLTASAESPSRSKIEKTSQPMLYHRALLFFIFGLSILASLMKVPIQPPQPYRPAERLITTGIWTVHFGIDLEGRDSQRRIRDLVRDMELDVLGLLESDLNRIVYGNRDLTKVVAEDLGYYVDLGPGPNQHTWGAALFSKFPIINSTHHLLPSPHGELAPAISAVIDVWGTHILIVVSHNGQEEDPRDRELQSAELARIMAEAYPMPAIFLGYVVTKPKASRPAPYEILTTDGKMHDIDGEDEERWCEYILYRGMYRTGYGRMARGNVTDTELQIGKFVLPPHGTAVVDDSHESRYRRSFKEDLPQRWWFNDSYYGNDEQNINGHYWHVFGTPLYYKLPENAN